jgi:hypothetical protein
MRWERDDNAHTASLEAIQARRALFAQKLSEMSIAACDDDMEVIQHPDIPGLTNE